MVPVRDTSSQSVTARSRIRTCTLKTSNTQLVAGRAGVQDDARSKEVGSSEGDGEVKVKTVQYLLGELKALIAGEGQWISYGGHLSSTTSRSVVICSFQIRRLCVRVCRKCSREAAQPFGADGVLSVS